ncbi:hypothetical protein M433DRAFT_157264 [Acidomyces richmondensis BFW]|nr:MAG: hypothetical protein FE78DRAFT_94080 [Acidomyces sp. 'richmondensis']KYG42975.1 hypothetical protein M433DRAFT_157264 [Acidomyces richmondensis BFW]
MNHGLKPVSILPDGSLQTFRQKAFGPALPFLLPRQTFNNFPALRKWFTASDLPALNYTYLSRFGATTVPLEITNNDKFTRIEQSLSFFLECVNASDSTYQIASPSRYFSSYVPGARPVRRTKSSNNFFSSAIAISLPTARVYLAQAPLEDLPQALRDDVPIPDLVKQSGKGDVYGSSLWLGQAPTYTPLHRDPNPNLFVQLAGKKVIRLFRPDVGQDIFAEVQERVGGSAIPTMRGNEMMQGSEKKMLEEEVWGFKDSRWRKEGWEAELGPGDAMFIPKAWWHSVKGVGVGINGSVNWWFR